MRFAVAAVLAGVATVAQAHFQLQFPAARGPFVEDDEPTFCDGFQNAVPNRTVFPLSGGVLTLNSEHPSWNLAVLLSTAQNPTSFDNFTNSTGGQQLARNFASATGEGVFCIPLDLSNTGISGVDNGANVTIQLLFNGGDDSLFQCADLTLSSSATVPSSVTCSNGTNTSPSSSTDPSATSPASSSPSVPTSPPSSAMVNTAKLTVAGLVGLIGAAVALAL